jgi:hypothetical protein
VSAKFPNELWDGTSLTQRNPNAQRAPDRWDYDVAVGEIIAIEDWLLNTFYVSFQVEQGYIDTLQSEMFTAQGDISAIESLLDVKFTDVWDDLRINTFSVQGAFDPVFTKVFDNGASSRGIWLWRFAYATTDQELFFNAQMPHAWTPGTTIYPHVHWLPAADGGAGEKVKWGLEYVVQEIGGVFPTNSTIIYSNVHSPNDSVLLTKKHYITSFAPITMTGLSESTMLMCRIFREQSDGTNDTLNQFAYILEFDFHFQSDKLGTVNEIH